MSFTTRSEFVDAAASEKTVIAHVQAASRLYTWSVYSGSVYSRVTPYFVYALKQDQTELSEVASIGAVVAGTFFYDVTTSTVYTHTVGSVDPATVQMIVTYKFFYANSTFSASHDLTDVGELVLYSGRITSNPGFKHKVGIEQALTSLVGTGTLSLQNNDGGLDEIYDTLVFENQECQIYSWNKDLAFSEAKIIYKGRITNKSYTQSSISFTIKDQIFDLEQKLPQNIYTSADNVSNTIEGRVKRWVYGKVDGMQIQSIDQIVDGYPITGTATGVNATPDLVGTGTLFLSEVSPGDTITVGGQEVTVAEVTDDLNIVLDGDLDYAFSGESMVLLPEIPTTVKNREFFVTDHACTQIVKTVVTNISLNRIELNTVTGLFPGDVVSFATGERGTISRLSAGNIIVLTQNLLATPAVSSNVTREPIQGVFVEGKNVLPENYTISNIGGSTNELKITLDTDTEFNLAKAKNLGVSLTFTNGTRTLTTAAAVDLRELLTTRDWIRPAGLTYTTYYEILSVAETSIELRVNFADPTTTDDATVKKPNYIGDDTVISVNVLGKTADGEPSGQWIFNASQAVKDMATEVGLTSFNTTKFQEAEDEAPQVLSLMLPTSITGSLTAAKDAIDLINKSVFGTLTMDNNLDMQYKILQNNTPDVVRVLRDNDVINWAVKATSGKNFRNSIISYRFQDYNNSTQQEGNSVAAYTSEFVQDYIGTNQTSELDVYLYHDQDATIMSHRYIYFNRLGRADITIQSDLRLEDVEIGDVLQLEFDRLYKRFGDNASRKKLVIVVGLNKSGESITIEATDLNNTFNTSAIITPNTAPDYSSATEDEKLKYGYITTDQGIVDNDETTANINLIS